MLKQVLGWAAVGLLLVGRGLAQDRGVLLVARSEDGTVAFLDPESGANLAAVRVGVGPRELAVSPDGSRAVVSNHGLATSGTTLSVIDVAGQRLRRTVSLSLEQRGPDGLPVVRTFHRPNGVCFTSDPTHVLVACETEGVLLLVDIEAGRVVEAIDTQQERPHLVRLDREGRRAFVTNERSGSISVIDLARRCVVKLIDTGGGAQGMALHPTADELWVSNVGTNSISVIDTVTLEEVAEFPCGAYPVRLAFSADGARVLCVNHQAGSLSVFDALARRLVHEVRLEQLSEAQAAERPLPPERTSFGRTPLPLDLLLSPDGGTVWVTCSRSDRLAELDLASLEVRRYIDAGGRGPDGLAWSTLEVERAAAK